MAKGISTGFYFKLLGALIVLALAVGAVIFTSSLRSTGAGASDYQAVFLTNGQVYFGQLSNRSATYLTLTNVYYLPGKTNAQSDSEAGQAEVSLIKLGKELHGPTDKMEIPRSSILFIEDLRSDSKVVKAIGDYQASRR